MIRLFVRRPNLHSTRVSPGFSVHDDRSAVPLHTTATHDIQAKSELSLVRAGRDWGLFSVRTTNDRLAADAVRPVFDTARAQRQGRRTGRPDSSFR